MFSLNDAHEYWWQGNPELEAHAFAKRSRSDGSAVQFQCAGEHAVEAAYQPGLRDQQYVYDQNANDWTGDVLLLNPAQMDTAMQAESAGFNIVLWEDDDIPCEIRQRDANYWSSMVQATVGVIRQGAVAVAARISILEWAIFGSRVFDLFRIAVGGDDYVGVLVEKGQTSYAGSYPDATHIVYEGSAVNGRARLELRQAPASANAVSQVFLTPYPVDNFAVGGGVQLEAKTYDYRGRLVTDRPVSWTSSNPAAVSVSSTGYVSASAAGTALIYATVDGVQSSRSVTAYGAVASVVVEPSYATTAVGGSVQFFATPYDVNGTMVPGRSGTWTSYDPPIATVDANGLAYANAQGSTTIEAVVDGVAGRAIFEVTAGCGAIACSRAPSVTTKEADSVGPQPAPQERPKRPRSGVSRKSAS